MPSLNNLYNVINKSAIFGKMVFGSSQIAII